MSDEQVAALMQQLAALTTAIDNLVATNQQVMAMVMEELGDGEEPLGYQFLDGSGGAG